MNNKKDDGHFLRLGIEMAHSFIVGKLAWNQLQTVANELGEDTKALFWKGVVRAQFIDQTKEACCLISQSELKI